MNGIYLVPLARPEIIITFASQIYYLCYAISLIATDKTSPTTNNNASCVFYFYESLAAV